MQGNGRLFKCSYTQSSYDWNILDILQTNQGREKIHLFFPAEANLFQSNVYILRIESLTLQEAAPKVKRC